MKHKEQPVDPRALDRVRGVAVQLAHEHGLEILRVEYVREEMGWILRVMVDRAGGVRVADCEKVARPLSKKLDELNLIRSSYLLEVCSPGTTEVEGVPNLGNRKAGPESPSLQGETGVEEARP